MVLPPAGASLRRSAHAFEQYQQGRVGGDGLLAKRRRYGTIFSYHVPPYGRSGRYLGLSGSIDTSVPLFSLLDGNGVRLCCHFFSSCFFIDMIQYTVPNHFLSCLASRDRAKAGRRLACSLSLSPRRHRSSA
jgi:hypothetical protein